MVTTFRQKDASTPIVLMGYANPVERYDGVHGKGSFIRDAAHAVPPYTLRPRIDGRT